MRTPKAKSAICEQDCATPEIFQEITNDTSRGQDVPSPQDTAGTQKLNMHKQSSGGHACFAEKSEGSDDKKKETSSASKRVCLSTSMKGPISRPDGYKSAHAACASSSSCVTDRKVFKDNYTMGKFISKALYGNIFTCVANGSSNNFACKVCFPKCCHFRECVYKTTMYCI